MLKKHTAIVLFALVFCAYSVRAQDGWYWQYPGEYGTILRSTNGGMSWSQQTSNTTRSFANRLVGVAAGYHGIIVTVGEVGTILHTTTAGVVTKVVDNNIKTLSAPVILSAFPNPASDFTTIPYHVARGGRVRVDVIDAVGNVVAVVVDDVVDTGEYEAPFQTHTLTPGVYVVRVRSGSNVDSKTLIVLR